MNARTLLGLLFLSALVSCRKSDPDVAPQATGEGKEPGAMVSPRPAGPGGDYRPAPPAPAGARPQRSPVPEGSRFSVNVDPSKMANMPAMPAAGSGSSITATADFGFPPGIGEAREFFVLNAEDQAEFARLEGELWGTSDPEKQAQILDQLAGYYGEELIGVAAKILATSEDEELRARAVKLLAGSTSASVLDFLAKAAKDPAEAVRAEAYYAAGNIRDARLVPFLNSGFADESGEVRWAAMEVVESLPERTRLEAFGNALDAPHTDVVLAAVDGLQMEGTHRGLEVLFKALDSGDPEVKEQAQWSVQWMIDQPFENAAEARAWWAENQKDYDQDLVYTPAE